MNALDEMDIRCHIWHMPVEVESPIPFEQDTTHASYDREYVTRFWRILLTVQPIFLEFRSRYLGKSSPLHFFWGSFDLALTRFSGRKAPAREGADPITKEAYSHEVVSAGWWTGSGSLNAPAFYAYAAPAPDGYYSSLNISKPAFYSQEFQEYVLLYDDVRSSTEPERVLMDFLQQTYEVAANLGKWDREMLERTISSAA
jgi:hypothetical protein